tara:strand:- start:2366 stop:2713 length:348 start_codon:yes stop_codon:yes gene_type:complete
MMDMWMELLEEIEAKPAQVWNKMGSTKKPVSVNEENGNVTITIELAGFGKEDVALEVGQHKVTVEAKKGDKDYSWTRKFDDELDSDSVTATMNNGVLDVVIEKKEKTSAKLVEIK